MDIDEIVAFLVCPILAFVLLLLLVVFSVRKEKKQKIKSTVQVKQDVNFTEAKIFSKEIKTYFEGLNIPRTVIHYIITFEIENGEKVSLSVSGEIFGRLKEDQEGTLVTVNGNFFYFGDGENIELDE